MNNLKNERNINDEERVIYALMIPKSKDFYIGHCRKDQLKSVFQDHYYGDRNQTQNTIAKIKEDGLHPCLFRLEQLPCSKDKAFRYVVAWTKIFHDSGYSNLNQGNVSEYIDNLLDDTYEIYLQRKNTNIPQLTVCNNCLVTYYNRKRCPLFLGEKSDFVCEKCSERPKQVKTYVSTGEYMQIQKYAKACGKTVSAYIRDTALDMVVINVDNTSSSIRTEAICGTYEAICRLVYKIDRDDQYVPADLEYILEKAKEMVKIEKTILQEQRESFDAIRGSISQTVKDTVQKNLNQGDCYL